MNTLTGAALESQYKATLETLGEQGGILGKIFKGAINKISNVAILYRIVQMINKEKWVSMSTDVKGEIYEGLLQKNAEDVKSGAGQYFTPRPLIRAMVRCLRPEPMKTIADPCCGSGGFFLAAQDFITETYQLEREQKAFLKNETFYGNELVAATFKLCLMNLYLHNIGETQVCYDESEKAGDMELGKALLFPLFLDNFLPYTRKSRFHYRKTLVL